MKYNNNYNEINVRYSLCKRISNEYNMDFLFDNKLYTGILPLNIIKDYIEYINDCNSISNTKEYSKCIVKLCHIRRNLIVASNRIEEYIIYAYNKCNNNRDMFINKLLSFKSLILDKTIFGNNDNINIYLSIGNILSDTCIMNILLYTVDFYLLYLKYSYIIEYNNMEIDDEILDIILNN